MDDAGRENTVVTLVDTVPVLCTLTACVDETASEGDGDLDRERDSVRNAERVADTDTLCVPLCERGIVGVPASVAKRVADPLALLVSLAVPAADGERLPLALQAGLALCVMLFVDAVELDCVADRVVV